ncbi:MAG: single-stranded DNA-binding protein [Chloroflexota bacterium]|nr:single-stranded DNA-binding protein [bacterium]MDE2780236.1 single-stranded DNA-binding protein [Chloroflexota bacterium]
MAKTINRVELLGRVGSDPEMRYTASGIAVTQLRLATDRGRRDGEPETDWHSVAVWGKLAEAVAEYVQKGQRLYVAGRLVQSSWEGDDGQRRYRTEVHAHEVVFLDPSRNGNGSNEYGNSDASTPADDDLPF